MTELFIAVFSASVIIGVATQLTHARHRGRVTSFSLGAMLLFVIISRIPSLDTPSFDINETLEVMRLRDMALKAISNN